MLLLLLLMTLVIYPIVSFLQALEKLGIKKGPKSIQRSHIIVEKGGKVGEVQAGDGHSDRSQV